jgi:hypothetical protein
MGKCFLHGNGGTSLNFKVVGGTSEPTNPKENTVWVKTSTDITNWVFSADQPSEPSDGMVWIVIGVSSTRAFNALKKNAIYIYPISAKQYENGAWKDKPSDFYQNGKWEDILQTLYIFQDGVFKVGNLETNTDTVNQAETYIEDGKIVLFVLFNNNADLYVSEAIDVSNHSKLVFVVPEMLDDYDTQKGTFIYGVVSSKEDSEYAACESVPVQTSTEQAEYVLDVSSLSGEYYIKAENLGGYTGSDSSQNHVYISEIRLEN